MSYQRAKQRLLSYRVKWCDMALPKWQYDDPAKHVKFRNERKIKPKKANLTNPFKEAEMTLDESSQIDDLLVDWIEWSRAYRPNLGAPRVAVYAGKAGDGDVYIDHDELDRRIKSASASQIDFEIEQLDLPLRIAVGIVAMNKFNKVAVFRHARFSREELMSNYSKAKALLLPKLVKRGLVKIDG